MSVSFRAAGLLLASVSFLDGCGSDSVGPHPTPVIAGPMAKLTITLPSSPVVAGDSVMVIFQATDSAGVPVAAAGAFVRIRPAASTRDSTVLLEAGGSAHIKVATGPFVGPNSFVYTLVDSLRRQVSSSTFSISTVVGPIARITWKEDTVNEYPCCAYPGACIHVRFEVQDSLGNPEVRQTLHLSPSGGSAVADSVPVTDDSGHVIAAWTLGPSTGSYSLAASGGRVTATALANAASGLPASLTVTDGNGERIPTGALPTPPIRLVVLDANGQPVAGVPVTWTEVGSNRVVCTTFTERFGVTVMPANSTPPCNWAPTGNGPGTLRASTVGGRSTTVSYFVLGPPASLTTVSGPPSGSQFPRDLALTVHYVVRLSLPDGSPAAGYTIGATATNPFVSFPRDTTAADGTADISYRVPRGVGPDTLRFFAVNFPDIKLTIVNYVVGPVSFDNIAAGTGFTCATVPRSLDWMVHCWGRNSERQLALDGGNRLVPTPTAINTLPMYVTGFDLGRAHGCFGAEEGGDRGLPWSTYYACWGANDQGQAGAPPSASVPPTNPGMILKDTGAGFDHTCAVYQVSPSGYYGTPGTPPRIFCWGGNAFGQLGDGTTIARSTPQLIAGDVTDPKPFVTAGDAFTCALNVKGSAFCWGKNDAGQLGDGTNITRLAPVSVAGPSLFLAGQLRAGASHVCAIGQDGVTYCWGNNGSGQLGDGTLTSRAVPTALNPQYRFTKITAGDSHTCALTADGSAYCWGSNSDGQLGNGSTGGSSTTPVAVVGGTVFKAISAGDRHTCGVRASDGRAMCWGRNTEGQLGDGTTTSRTVPTAVADYRP